MNHRVVHWSGIPQIMYNHHQTGPGQNGAVIFMPPFRDPFNYNFDPMVPLGIEDGRYRDALAGSSRNSEGGSTPCAPGANYSTWWNGGLRTVSLLPQP